MYTVPVAEQRDIGWRFVGLWMLILMLASGFGMAALIFIAPLVFIVLPIAQWFVLRRYIQASGWWIPLVCVGHGLAVTVLATQPLINLGLGTVGLYIANAGVVGLTIGGAQFLVLRRSIPQAAWCIVLQALAALAGLLVAAYSLVVTHRTEPFLSFASIGGIMVVYSITTSLGMRLILAASSKSQRQLYSFLGALGLICGLAAIAI